LREAFRLGKADLPAAAGMAGADPRRRPVCRQRVAVVVAAVAGGKGGCNRDRNPIAATAPAVAVRQRAAVVAAAKAAAARQDIVIRRAQSSAPTCACRRRCSTRCASTKIHLVAENDAGNFSHRHFLARAAPRARACGFSGLALGTDIRVAQLELRRGNVDAAGARSRARSN
jgi:hypothetical protein